MGLAPGMEPGISPTYSPSAPLSAQETNVGLNIDSLLHKTGMGGDRCCSVPVRFISLQWKTEIVGTLALSAPSYRGGEGRQRRQPGEGNSGQGCPDSPWGLDTWVWQDLGSNQVLVNPLCPGKVRLSSDRLHRPSLSPRRAVLLKTLQLKPNPHPAVPLSPLRSWEESSPANLSQ